MRATDRATLATAQRDAAGWPYASLVMIALDHTARPLLLISRLADHTKNLERDPRASLLVDATVGLDEPLAGARATVMGRAAAIDDPEETATARGRFLRRHPSAELYVDFGDFAFWRLEVERAHLVAGFGAIHWIDGTTVLSPPDGPLPAQEREVVAHMNADHADALVDIVRHVTGMHVTGVTITSMDDRGFDVEIVDDDPTGTARIPSPDGPIDPSAVRQVMVDMTRRARDEA